MALGKFLSIAFIPIISPGKCSGPNLIRLSMLDNTSSFMMVAFLYISPPCSTLCPTPIISSFELTTLFSYIIESKTFIASSCSWR